MRKLVLQMMDSGATVRIGLITGQEIAGRITDVSDLGIAVAVTEAGQVLGPGESPVLCWPWGSILMLGDDSQ